MELELTRTQRGQDDDLIGELTLEDGTRECYIMERASLAIPCGRFLLKLTVSGRAAQGTLWSPEAYRPRLPQVMDVPNREGIRAHAGNHSRDSIGCLITGDRIAMDTITSSRPALERLMNLLDGLERSGQDCYLTVREAFA